MAFDVTELLVELKLELINLSSENGREHALQAMMNICPGMLTGIPFQGVTHSLERPGLGESNGVEVVCHHLGSLFCDMASLCSPAAPKVILESKHKRIFFPKFIVQLDLPIFFPVMGLCTRPRGVGLQACFAQGVCLWVTYSYHHNLKNCMNILSAQLNSWGMFPDSPNFFV